MLSGLTTASGSLFLECFGDGGVDFLYAFACIDGYKPVGFLLHDAAVALIYLAVKVETGAFHPVEFIVVEGEWNGFLGEFSYQGLFRKNIKVECDVGLQSAGGEGDDGVEGGKVYASAVSLIGGCGVEKTVEYDGCSLFEGGADDFVDQFGAAG